MIYEYNYIWHTGNSLFIHKYKGHSILVVQSFVLHIITVYREILLSFKKSMSKILIFQNFCNLTFYILLYYILYSYSISISK